MAKSLRAGALAYSFKGRAGIVLALGLSVAVAACAPKAPPPPPPPPPKIVIIPPRPTPPNGASDNLLPPPVDAMGVRQSVNRNISPAQMVWNLRSAYNVAALNCTAPKHADILPLYRTFLKVNAKGLTLANKKVDAEFKEKYGAKFIAPREGYMTAVYNHYALPPTLSDFCDAVQAVGRDAALVKPVELEAFSVRSLPNVEVVFDEFYRRYDKYRSDLAIWQAQYGQQATAGAAQTSPAASAQPVIVLPQGVPVSAGSR